MRRDRFGTALVVGWLALAGSAARAEPAPVAVAPKPAPPAVADKSKPASPAGKEAAPAPAAVQPLALDTAATRKLLAAVPALAALAAEFTPFESADADAALRRGGRGRESISVWAFQPAAFSWKPAPDRELWVLSGRSGKRAVLVVLERGTDGQMAHAASAVLDEPDTTIAVGFSASTPAELLWTSCYACPGEGGAIRLRADRRVDIAFR